jgi:hypothetical protein
MEGHFCQNFTKLINNPYHSDFVFVTSDDKVPAHTMILKQSCPLFAKVNRNEMSVPFDKPTLLHGLEYLYTGDMQKDLNLTQYLDLLDFSAFLYLENLRFMILNKIEYKSLEYLDSDDFLNLKQSHLIYLLGCGHFKVSSELKILTRVLEWHQRNRFDDFDDVLECIRFTLIPYRHFETLEHLVAKKWLIHALKLLIRKQPEESRGGPIPFEYKNDFDTNGIIYYLGLQKDESWINPIHNGNLTVSVVPSRGTSLSGGKSSDIVELNSKEIFIFSSFPCGWVFDFGIRSVCLSAYTFRHFNQNCCFVLEWEVFGSNDDDQWFLIQSYSYQDSPFSGAGQTKTFPIDTNDRYYRYIKIMQKLNTTNNNFGISQMEMYGKMF